MGRMGEFEQYERECASRRVENSSEYSYLKSRFDNVELENEKLKETILELRELVYNEDIPHPTIPEYIEHHNSIKKILKFIDDRLLEE